jgi:HD superfamily phosphohydrolase
MIDFEEKTINDSVHKSVGLSGLEQTIINSRTFQRLRKIRQLGFAHYVFPGAEHSRFSHSIGVMHVMSRMIDQLRLQEAGPFSIDEESFCREKQKLRLAALLHDIGHYPLSHLGEEAMQWIDSTELAGFEGGDEESRAIDRVFHEAGHRHSSERVEHERLGQAILSTDGSELREIIHAADYDPDEIARIFNGEDTENPFHTQLLSSTLDCDRLDYLLRDSAACGVRYGQIELEYILQNMRWDSDRKLVCFQPKAIHALEHFITSRYHYYNVSYHKTVRAFEVMAKTLFYAMMKWPEFDNDGGHPILMSFDQVKERIALDREFLANYNDEYFWFYLERWRPQTERLRRLKSDLLHRVPIRVVAKQQIFVSDGDARCRYNYLATQMWHDDALPRLLGKYNLAAEDLTPVQTSIDFEAVSSTLNYPDRFDEAKQLRLIKIRLDDQTRDLIELEHSIVRVLSQFQQKTIRIYALVDGSVRDELERDFVAHIESRARE